MLFPVQHENYVLQMAHRQKCLFSKPESLQVHSSLFGIPALKEPISYICKTKNRVSPEKASAFSEGSLTLEAAWVLPLVVMFWITFFAFFQVMSAQLQVQNLLEEKVDQLIEAALFQTDTPLSQELLGEVYLRQVLKKDLGKIAGVTDVDFSGTKVDLEQAIVDVTLQYSLENSLEKLFPSIFRLSNRCRKKMWTGVEWDIVVLAEDIVYATPHGEVYHEDLDCSYLNVRVKEVKRTDLQTLRNADGKIYQSCETCKPKKEMNTLYVTAYGEVYHGTLACSGLKRTIQTKTSEEVEELRPCSKCVKVS